MKYNLKSFQKRSISLPQHPDVKKAVSYADRTIYINADARPGANIILYEAPKDQQVPERPLPWMK